MKISTSKRFQPASKVQEIPLTTLPSSGRSMSNWFWKPVITRHQSIPEFFSWFKIESWRAWARKDLGQRSNVSCGSNRWAWGHISNKIANISRWNNAHNKVQPITKTIITFCPPVIIVVKDWPKCESCEEESAIKAKSCANQWTIEIRRKRHLAVNSWQKRSFEDVKSYETS